MNLPDILSLVVAIVALVVALIALAMASQASKARASLEAWLGAQRQTDIQVLFLRKAAGTYNFTLANRGQSSARNVSLRLLDDVPAGANPLSVAGARMPVPQIDPGGYFQIPAVVNESTPREFRVRVTWINAGGLETVKEIALNLLD